MPTDWIEALGIVDAATGQRKAKDARDLILEPAGRVIGSSTEVTKHLIVFQGFVARAQGLHEAAIQAADAGNPHATFTLLRAQAENVAAILYAKDKPNEVQRFADPDDYGIPVGRIKDHAKSRFDGFRQVYDELSRYAHPHGKGVIASLSMSDDGKLHWQSSAHFRKTGDQLCAYAWAVELAEATRHLLYEFARDYRLGYFGAPSDS